MSTTHAHATIPDSLVAQGTYIYSESLGQEQRGCDVRGLYKVIMRIGRERHTWYQAQFWSERFGTTDTTQTFSTLEAAQAAYDLLF